MFAFLLPRQQLRKGLQQEVVVSDCCLLDWEMELSGWFRVAVRWGLKAESSGLLAIKSLLC